MASGTGGFRSDGNQLKTDKHGGKEMQICTIASGSSGNCVYIGDDETHILVDAGVSRKRIVEGLKSIGVTPDMLSGIFVTHEHSDHIKGLRLMEKMFGVPVFATEGTLQGIRDAFPDSDSIFVPDKITRIKAEESIRVKSMKITPFSISHDAREPVGFTVESRGKKTGIATDLGKYDDCIIGHLEGSNILVLEANHDVSMLETGPYPYVLKQRILSDKGHLSNDSSGRLVSGLLWGGLECLCLAHLSHENNYPELALQTVRCSLWEEKGMKSLPFEMFAAKRNMPSHVVTV